MTSTSTASLLDTTITPTVDFAQNGVQHGFLQLPYSHDDSAWGAIMIPISVIQNGPGPTALLTGGNHGDEYEGITALLKLAKTLQPEMITGRVIIVPAMNFPAALAGKRTSPIDQGNLNRSFPGNPQGTMTERIADYFRRYLVPLCDYALDIHSGGRTLDFIPFSAAHRLADKEQEARCTEAARQFGAPACMVLFELDSASMYDTAVESQGKVFVTTEIRGGGTTTPESLLIAERGVRNFLRTAGILPGPLEVPEQPVQFLDMPDASCYVISQHKGVLELTRNLGDRIQAGERIASVHPLDYPGAPAVDYFAPRDGVLAARRFPALTQMGDTLAVIADVL